MKRVKWYIGLLLVGTLLFVGGCTKEPTGYSNISIPIEEFLLSSSSHPHIDVVMHAVVGEELTVTLGSNPTTGFWWEDAEISDESIIKQVNHEFVAPETDVPGTPGQEVWTFEALKKGTVTTFLEYSRRNKEDVGHWMVTITTTVK